MTLDNPTLLGIAAVVSAIGGAASTIMAIRKQHSEEEQECRERLKQARAEAESSAQELHERKMRDYNHERS